MGKRGNKLYVNWKDYDNSFNNIHINKKRHCIKWVNTFLSHIEHLEETLTSLPKVDFSNYATKKYLRNAAGLDTCKLAVKSDLAGSKAEIHKIDTGKIKDCPCWFK